MGDKNNTNTDAYPTTIRLTFRRCIIDNIDNSNNSNTHRQQKRSYETKSKQCHFNGKKYFKITNPTERIQLLKTTIKPILTSLLCNTSHDRNNSRPTINITRIN